MKNIFKIALPVIMIITGFASQRTFAQSGANKSLSNLKAPVAVNQSLVANADSALELGSPTIGWKNLYLSGNIYFYNARGVFINGTNSAVGLNALIGLTTGTHNTAIGESALFSNTSGVQNTATGWNSMYSNLLGYGNTANGFDALYSNTVGIYNTASGQSALFSNTEGDYNTAMGLNALSANTSGNYNTAVGYNALRFNTSGSYNTAIGRYALYNSTSEYNTSVGYASGDSYDNSTYNTFVGYDADANAAGYTNSTGLGRSGRITASNQVRVGNSSVTSIGGYAPWSDISDGRFKKNVKEDVYGLEFINKLRPVTYTLDVHGINKQTQVEEQEGDAPSIAEKEKIKYSGFIAQEVEKAAKEIGYDFSGVDAPKNETDLYGLRYAEFVVPLVKAVQEQQAVINELRTRMEDLKTEMNMMKNTIEVESKTNNIELKSACLDQNIPNPFDHTTIIGYYLPENSGKALIQIVSPLGKPIKTIPILGKGKGQIILKSDEFSSGTYIYQLVIDESIVDSKQMILMK